MPEAPPTRVVLVRPWTDAHAGAGCCSGDARYGVCVDRGPGHPHDTDPSVAVVGAVYRALREELPHVEVQVVSASNTPYLVPSVYRATRARAGRLAALRHATRATTAGAVLVDGVRIGDMTELGVDGVLVAVRSRVAMA